MWITQKESKRMTRELIEVSCAVIMEGDRVLLTQRSEQMPHPLKWEFPGGKLLPGETPEICLVREIREELGLEIDVLQLLPTVRHSYPEHTIKLIPFICSIRAGKIDLSEHRSYRWVRRAELEQMDWLEADVEVVLQLKKYS